MFDPTRLLGGMLSGGFSRQSSGSTMPSLGGAVAGIAGVAAIGGVAYLAYQAYQKSNLGNAPPGYPPPQQPGGYGYPPQADPYAYPPQAGAYPPAQQAPVDPNAYVPYYLRGQAPAAVAPAPAMTAGPTAADHETALLLVRAMIAAANADGQIDETERAGILARLTEAGVDGAERNALVAELQRPVPPSVLVAGVRSPDMAAQVYAVSLAAIKADTDAEKSYLRGLAAMLALPPETVRELHGHMGVQPPDFTTPTW
jgi:uncharacterized membrane protein YebE (DUF533 family)